MMAEETPKSPEEIRADVYHAIRREFTSAMARFYKTHPEWINDERSRRNMSMLLELAHCTFKILDNYLILPNKES